MGEVYRAEDESLGRFVAIKTLLTVDAADATSFDRLRNEARAVASLTHPNILSIFDFGVEGSLTYCVTELLEGETVDALIARGPIGHARVIAIGIAVADALACAHRTGLVHRDLKPANVFVTREGVVKILDFGLSQRTQPQLIDASTRTAVRPDAGLAGTLLYMAPEQLQGAAPRPASDLFSLGIMLWEMLTGQHPFRRSSVAETIPAILRDEPASAGAERISEPLRRILLHSLEKEETRRFQSAGDIAFALHSLSSEMSSTAVDVSKRVPSLCVLPFDCHVDDLDAEFLSEGLAETLINRFAHLSYVTVIARTTAFRYRGTTMLPAGVAAELRADYVLTGKVRQHRGSLLIQAELVDGRTGSQIWGQRFVRTPDDVFRIEQEIGQAIVEQLAHELARPSDDATPRSPADSPAYTLYLRGRFEWDRRTPDAIQRAIALFEEATRVDGAFALAWCGLADVYNVSAYHGWANASEIRSLATSSARRALDLDPDLPEALVSWSGVIGTSFGGDIAGGAALLRRAIERKPSYSTALHWLSHSEFCSHNLDEARRLSKRALEVDPMATSVLLWSADLHYYLREFQKAVDTYRRALQIDPDSPSIQALLGTALVMQDQHGAGIALLESSLRGHEAPRCRALLAHARSAAGDGESAQRDLEKLRLYSSRIPVPYDLAIALSGGDDFEGVIENLSTAYDLNIERVLHAPFEPKFDRFRDRPGFSALMERLRERVASPARAL